VTSAHVEEFLDARAEANDAKRPRLSNSTDAVVNANESQFLEAESQSFENCVMNWADTYMIRLPSVIEVHED
jgi:hypothetical protein